LPLIDSLELLRYVFRVPADRFARNVRRLRELLDLDPFLRTPVRQLSLGQRMRGDLAAALLHDPEILYLDEPTIGLDVVAKERIREFLLAANREYAKTAPVKRENQARNAIQQETIMRDKHQSARKVHEALFQHLQRGNVEIIGWFVKNQKVGRLEKHLGQSQTTLFTAAQNRNAFFNGIARKQKRAQQGAQFRHDFSARVAGDFLIDRVLSLESLGLLLGRTYARWCTQRMAGDAARHFDTR